MPPAFFALAVFRLLRPASPPQRSGQAWLRQTETTAITDRMNRNQRRTLEKLSQGDGVDLTLGEAFGLALHHHRAGRLEDAVDCYQRILELEPRHVDALGNLGAALRRLGQTEEAVRIYRQALEVQPQHPDILNNLGSALQSLGRYAEAAACFEQAVAGRRGAVTFWLNLGCVRLVMRQYEAAVAALQETIRLKPDLVDGLLNLGAAYQGLGLLPNAITCYQKILRFKPDHVLALVNLGNLFQSQGALEQACRCFGKALAADPRRPEVHYNFGNTCLAMRQHERAIAHYQTAILLRPEYARAHLNLGSIWLDRGDIAIARQCFTRALTLDPQQAVAHMNIGNTYQNEGRLAEAEEACRHALRLAPDYADARVNLGAILQAMERLEDAEAELREAVRLAPTLAPACLNLGLTLRLRGDLAGAEHFYREALRLRPDYAEAHVGLAMVLFLGGHLEAAWPHYEWRWKVRDWPTAPRPLAMPLWQGENLAGRTILLHAEQGLGDMIQFVRYVPLVAEQGARVLLQAPRLTHALFSRLPGVAQILDDDDAVPDTDFHCPFMTLPLVLGTTAETIPGRAPYLRSTAEARKNWRMRVAGGRRHLKVGLVWGGNPAYRLDRMRSMALDVLLPLLSVPRVIVHSLQLGERVAEITACGLGDHLIDLSPHLSDLQETAAAMDNLDLVITVDTAVGHLAGALGRPVWILLPHAPDWRWRIAGNASAWYPTARLFRQSRPGNWEQVVAEVTAELQAMTGARAVGRG